MRLINVFVASARKNEYEETTTVNDCTNTQKTGRLPLCLPCRVYTSTSGDSCTRAHVRECIFSEIPLPANTKARMPQMLGFKNELTPFRN